MKKETQEAINLVAQTIYDKKGSNILALDVSLISSLTDAIIIAEGLVDRHVSAIAKEIIAVLKERGVDPIHVEGLQNGDWVVLDFLDFMIHIFKPEVRDLYQLEKLWSAGKPMELSIDTSAPQMKRFGDTAMSHNA